MREKERHRDSKIHMKDGNMIIIRKRDIKVI